MQATIRFAWVASLLFGFVLGTPVRAMGRRMSRNPNVGFATLAPDINALTRPNGSCRHSLGDLTDLEWSATGGLPSRTTDVRDWACHKTRQNLLHDTMKACLPAADAVFNNKWTRAKTIKGHIFYEDKLPKMYHYRIEPTHSGDPSITVRVHFRGEAATMSALWALQFKMNQAADLWRKSSPHGAVGFHFLVEEDRGKADFSVHLITGPTRGPYDTTWSTKWSFHSIAHEVGHMMGLDDEYNQLNATLFTGITGLKGIRCDSRSIMCMSFSDPQPYHYYLILRRRYCHEIKGLFPGGRI